MAANTTRPPRPQAAANNAGSRTSDTRAYRPTTTAPGLRLQDNLQTASRFSRSFVERSPSFPGHPAGKQHTRSCILRSCHYPNPSCPKPNHCEHPRRSLRPCTERDYLYTTWGNNTRSTAVPETTTRHVSRGDNGARSQHHQRAAPLHPISKWPTYTPRPNARNIHVSSSHI